MGVVYDGVAPAQQHLGADVGTPLAQRRQPVPWSSARNANAHVVGRAPPALQADGALRARPANVRGDGEQSRCAHRWPAANGARSRKVVSVTATACARGSRPRTVPARARPAAAGSRGRRHPRSSGQLLDGFPEPLGRGPLGCYGGLGEVGQTSRAAVGGGGAGGQLRASSRSWWTASGWKSGSASTAARNGRFVETSADPELRDRPPGGARVGKSCRSR